MENIVDGGMDDRNIDCERIEDVEIVVADDMDKGKCLEADEDGLDVVVTGVDCGNVPSDNVEKNDGGVNSGEMSQVS